MITRILAIARVETASFLRSKLALFWTFAYPALLLLVLNAIFGGEANQGVRIQRLEVINLAQNEHSRQFVEHLGEELSAHGVEPEVLEQSEDGSNAVELTIPSGWKPQSESSLSILVPRSHEAQGTVSAIFATLESFERSLNGTPRLFETEVTLKKGNTSASYAGFLICGMAALTLISTTLFGFSQILIEQRAHGGFKMLQVMPLHRGEFLVGFILSRVAILTAYCLLFIVGANFALGAGLELNLSSLGLATLYLLLGITAFLSCGLFIAAIVQRSATGVAVTNVLNLLIMMSSDLFIPVRIMPPYVQSLVEWSPVYLFVNGLRALFQDVPEVAAMPLTASIVLTGMMLLSLVIASRTFRWRAS